MSTIKGRIRSDMSELVEEIDEDSLAEHTAIEDFLTAQHEAAHCVVSYVLGRSAGSVRFGDGIDFAGIFERGRRPKSSDIAHVFFCEGIVIAAGQAIDLILRKEVGLPTNGINKAHSEDNRQIREMSSYFSREWRGNYKKEVKSLAKILVSQIALGKSINDIAVAMLKDRSVSKRRATGIMRRAGVVPGMYDAFIEADPVLVRLRFELVFPNVGESPALSEAA
jgi:hypothetical protein